MRSRLFEKLVVFLISFFLPLQLVAATHVLTISSPWGSGDEDGSSYELEFHPSGLLRSVGIAGEPPDALVLYHGQDPAAENAFRNIAQRTQYTQWLLMVAPDYQSFTFWQNRFPDGSIDGEVFPVAVEQRGLGRVTLVEGGDDTWQLTASPGSVSVRIDHSDYHREYALEEDSAGSFTILTDLGGNRAYVEAWRDEEGLQFFNDQGNEYTLTGDVGSAGTDLSDYVRALINFVTLNLVIDWYAATAVAFFPLVR